MKILSLALLLFVLLSQPFTLQANEPQDTANTQSESRNTQGPIGTFKCERFPECQFDVSSFDFPIQPQYNQLEEDPVYR